MLKSFVKRTIRSIGFDVKRYQPSSSEAAQFIAMLTAHRINLMFDVGANTGQFGRLVREIGYTGRVVSFEPLPDAYAELTASSQSDKLWDVAPRGAIGATDGEIDIHVSGNSVSSSVLDMLDAHSDAAPESSYVGTEKVPMKRLDSVAFDYLRADSSLFIKIDTQGYEDQVLQGAPRLLERAVGLQLELSLLPLYKDQLLYDEMIAKLKAIGFELWSLTPVFFDPATARLLQVDATFFRTGA